MTDPFPGDSVRTSEVTEPFGLARAAAKDLEARCGGGPHHVAIVLGSGWIGAVDHFGPVDHEILLRDLPGFAASSVPGHGASVRSSWLGDVRILTFLGRVHLYEGNAPSAVVLPVRAAVMAGCDTVILTNAAGALDPTYAVGDGVLISDHLNLTGVSALTGSQPPEPFGSRFVDLSDAYSPRLRAIARDVEPTLHEGVYAALHGPNYETPAEIRMLRTMGADLVGMSTALETMAARHLEAEVLGLSLVTNQAAGVGDAPLDHREVLEAGEAAADRLGRLLATVIERGARGAADPADQGSGQ
jgi:purine-nucleoside phosphorylase